MTKQKSLKENVRVGYLLLKDYLLPKYCARQCALLAPTWTKSFTIKILHDNARF